MLAWLQYKDKCWHNFMVKTLDVATLQKTLEMAASKSVEKTSVGAA